MLSISIQNIRKEFSSKSFSKNKIVALDKVSFNVGEGEIFGLLGPNGAGKTTLIKILLGITHPTEGDAKLFDKDIKDFKARKNIGYLPENHKFPNYLNGQQVMHYFGMLSGMKKNDVIKKSDEYLKLVEMEKWKKTKIKKYSKGMMQRLGLAQSLLNDPKLIFLDEPTDGVDPIGRKQIRDILLNLKAAGKTIFLNSHLLSEIELICDRVAILNQGQLIKEGSVLDITTSSDTFNFVTSEISDEIANTLLNNYKATINSKINFSCKVSGIKELNEIIDYLRKQNIFIENVAKEKSSLESMFINLIEQSNN
jgi:ABC-2 type transport system ATP-binding protein